MYTHKYVINVVSLYMCVYIYEEINKDFCGLAELEFEHEFKVFLL